MDTDGAAVPITVTITIAEYDELRAAKRELQALYDHDVEWTYCHYAATKWLEDNGATQ
jgi:hypothetical protein